MTKRATCFGLFMPLLALVLGGCSDGLGPEGESDARVFLSSTSSPSQAILASVAAAGAGEVSLDDVAAIEVTISGVQAVLQDAENDGGWVALELAAAATNPIDLLSLPGSGILIANGDLAPGTYSNVRIFFESATITLQNDVTLGGEVYAAEDSPYDLFIPSGAETGIKVPTAAFEVLEGAGGDVTIEFDATLSVGTVAVTGAGLLMEPVLREEPQN